MTKQKKQNKPKKITKKKQKSMARTAKRKALQSWSESVRNRDNNKCIVCQGDKFIQAHHLIPKERFPEYMYEIMNGISLCPTCHKFGSYSFHRHPIWSIWWLQNNRPIQYEWTMERSKISLEQIALS